MSFKVSEYNQKKFDFEISKDLAEVVMVLIADQLEVQEEKTELQDKIDLSVRAELYNIIAKAMNRMNSKDSIKLKLFYHQSYSLMTICQHHMKTLAFEYKLQLSKVATEIHQKL